MRKDNTTPFAAVCRTLPIHAHGQGERRRKHPSPPSNKRDPPPPLISTCKRTEVATFVLAQSRLTAVASYFPAHGGALSQAPLPPRVHSQMGEEDSQMGKKSLGRGPGGRHQTVDKTVVCCLSRACPCCRGCRYECQLVRSSCAHPPNLKTWSLDTSSGPFCKCKALSPSSNHAGTTRPFACGRWGGECVVNCPKRVCRAYALIFYMHSSWHTIVFSYCRPCELAAVACLQRTCRREAASHGPRQLQADR